MKYLHVDRYRPKNPGLKRFIKYFWVLKCDLPINLNHKLLPVNNIDFVLNFSSPLKYSSGGKIEEIPKYSFTGVRKEYYFVQQSGVLDIIGVSFFPAGLYPIVKIPLSEFKCRTTELELIIPDFNLKMEETFASTVTILERIDALEYYFMELVDFKYVPTNETYRLIDNFRSNMSGADVNCFCDRHGINQRKLERVFNKYIGIGPKFFKKINRFQLVLNRMINKEYNDFTSLAYDNDYCDQAHFIKDFRSFTGCSPSRFVKEKKSVKEIIADTD